MVSFCSLGKILVGRRLQGRSQRGGPRAMAPPEIFPFILILISCKDLMSEKSEKKMFKKINV